MSICCASAPAPSPRFGLVWFIIYLLQIMQCSLCGEECRSWWELPLSHFSFFCLPCKAHKPNHTGRITGEGKGGRSEVFGKSSEDISAPMTPSLRLKPTGRIWFDGEERKAQPPSKSHWSWAIQQNKTAPCQGMGVLRYLCAWWTSGRVNIHLYFNRQNNWKNKEIFPKVKR